MDENASLDNVELMTVTDGIEQGNSNTEYISDRVEEIETTVDSNYEQLREIAGQLGLTSEGEEELTPFYELITEIHQSNNAQVAAQNDTLAAIDATNSQLKSLNESVTKELQETSIDYSEQFSDMGTLLSYTNVLMLVLIVFVLFDVGIRAGGMVTQWLKTR